MAGLGAIGNIGQLVATLGLNTMPFQKGMDDAKKGLVALNNGAMMIGRTMTRFVTLPMVLAGGAAVKTQKNFEASMTKIIGLVGVSREVVEGWTKEVLKMSSVTGRGPEELADALYFVTSAGIRGAEAMKVLEMSAKASAVGLGETKTVADLVTSAMNAYGKENLSAAQATDILVASVREGKAEADELAGAMGMVLPIASEFGVTFDQVGAAFAGMTRTGTNARVAATQLKNILATMASPSEQTQKALAKYSMTAEDFRKVVREDGLIQALLDLRQATMGNEEAMSEIFPNIRGLMGVLDLLGANVEYNTRIFEALKNASGSLQRAFAEVQGTTQQKLNVAMATLQATLVSIGEALKPLVVRILSRLNDRLMEMSRTWQLLTESQRKLKVTMLGLAAAAGPVTVAISRMVAIMTSAIKPYFLAATAIIAVATAISKLVKAHQTVSRIQGKVAEQMLVIEKNASKEASAIKRDFEALMSAKKGTEEWSKARDVVVGKYGQYLDNIEEEISSQERLQEAMAKVTETRLADLRIKGYKEQLEDIGERVDIAVDQVFKRFNKSITKGLEKGESFVITDYTLGLEELFKQGLAGLQSGRTLSEVEKEMGDTVREFYNMFFGGLSTVPFRAGESGGDYYLSAFKKALELKAGQTEITEALQAKIEGEMKKIQTGNVQIQIENIDKEIANLEGITGELKESERLWQLIGLHKQKASLLGGELREQEEQIAKGYEEALQRLRAQENSLSTIERIKATIAQKEKEQMKASASRDAQLEKEIAQQKILLAEKENERAAYNSLLKLQKQIEIDKEKAAMLEGDRAKKAWESIRADERKAELMAAELDGLNDLAIMQIKLRQMEEDWLRTSSDKQKAAYEELVLARQTMEIRELEAKGASQLYVMEKKIEQAEKNMWMYQDEKLKSKKDELQEMQKKYLEYKKEHGALTAIEQAELDILKVKIAQKSVDDPDEARRLAAELAALEEELDVLSGKNPFLDIDKHVEGSIGWFGAMLDAIRKVKEDINFWESLEKDMSEPIENSKAMLDDLWETVKANAKEITAAVLAGAGAFAQSMVQLQRARMDAELKMVEGNEAAKEQIQKKYYKKMQKWQVAAAIMNTASAAIKALDSNMPILKWIDFGLVLAAGAAQLATIKAQSFAQGGMVYGETLARVADYPSARSNPEVIAPLSDLKKYMQPASQGLPKEIVLRLRGRDAVAVIDTQRLLNNTY